MDQKWSEAVQTLLRLRRQREKDNLDFLHELEELESRVFKELCVKRKYMKQCEPSYCCFRITGSCEFIKTWHEIKCELDSLNRD